MKATHLKKSITVLSALAIFAAGCSGGSSGDSVTPSPNIAAAPSSSGLIVGGSSGVTTPSIGSSSTTVGFGATDTVSDIATTQAAQDVKLDKILAQSTSANKNAKDAKSSANWAMYLGIGALSLMALERMGAAYHQPGGFMKKLGAFTFNAHNGEISQKVDAAKGAAEGAKKSADDGFAASTKRDMALAAQGAGTQGLILRDMALNAETHHTVKQVQTAQAKTDAKVEETRAIARDTKTQLVAMRSDLNTKIGALETSIGNLSDAQKEQFKLVIDQAKSFNEKLNKDLTALDSKLNADLVANATSRAELEQRAVEVKALQDSLKKLDDSLDERVGDTVKQELKKVNSTLADVGDALEKQIKATKAQTEATEQLARDVRRHGEQGSSQQQAPVPVRSEQSRERAAEDFTAAK